MGHYNNERGPGDQLRSPNCSGISVASKEHLLINLAIALRSPVLLAWGGEPVIENLVRGSTGNTLDQGRHGRGCLGVWQEHGLKQVGTHSLVLCLKVSSLVFPMLLYHTFILHPKCCDDHDSMALPKPSYLSFINVHLTNDYVATEPQLQCYKPGLSNPETPGFPICSSFCIRSFLMKPGSL